jgi:hypothetical protein
MDISIKSHVSSEFQSRAVSQTPEVFNGKCLNLRSISNNHELMTPRDCHFGRFQPRENATCGIHQLRHVALILSTFGVVICTISSDMCHPPFCDMSAI